VPRRLAAVVCAAALALAACTSGGEPGGQDVSPSPTEDLAVKPEFDIPTDTSPPSGLEIEVLAEGDGDTVAAGDVVAMHYVGKSWSTGRQFDASWDREQPFVFQVGAGQVIQGWELGILGDGGDIAPMTVGERRRVTIPPELGYGDRGAGGVIAPGETLVFVVDLLSIEDRGDTP
jgi:peptidylprolyl isomerase